MSRFRKSHKIKKGRVNHPEHMSVNCNYVYISTALTGKLASFVGWKGVVRFTAVCEETIMKEQRKKKKRKLKGMSKFSANF